MTINKLLPTLGLLLLNFLGFSQTVSSVGALQTALDNATAGATITIENGTYSNADLEIEATGTAANPIIIQAETPGGVIFEDNCRIKMGGAYITLTGVVFTGTYSLNDSGANSYVISFNNGSDCDNCTVTQVQIDGYNPSSVNDDLRWIRVYGQDNEISYNTFINKTSVGSMLFNQRDNGIEDRMKIHHNYFAFRTQIGVADSKNDIDVMRIGDSNQSLSNSSSEVYDNYFYEVNGGEPEVISNKSSNNKYYNNTFENYLGSLSLRHGNDCKIYNNFFLNPGQDESYFNGGIRIEGERHMVYNNYIQGTNGTKQNSSSKAGSLGAINVSAGQSESNFVLNGYGQVIDAIIVNNTIVDCDQGLRVGPDSGGENQNLAPDSITVANNLFVNCGQYIEEDRPATNSVFQGNMFEGNGSATNGFSSETGLLSTTLENGYYPIEASSPAVNASVGNYAVYFADDVFAGSRSGVYDVGAQEYGATMEKGPYTQANVGITVGFGASSGPVLNASPSSLTFAGPGGNLSFEISTENDTTWDVAQNVSWIILSTEQGTGSGTITVTATDNSGGATRNGVITIEASNGESTLVTITQTNESFTSSEITIIGATAIGTQTDKPNEVGVQFAWDNSYDQNVYWSGNTADGAEVSITLDLECNHTLKEIGIDFLKDEQRTTNFSVAIALDGSATFTNVFTGDSAQTNGGSDSEIEQLFDLNNTVGRYVKITGNSTSNSTFTSFVEFSLYGNVACETTLSNESFESFADKGVTLFPVPVTNGELIIVSPKYAVNGIEVYNMAGQEVLSAEANNQNTTQIYVSDLTPGVYFIVLEEIGVGKFIVK